jgi:hypothetical protein
LVQYQEFEGARVKIEFDAPAIHQPSMVHEVERLGMMVISKDQDKVVTFSTLIPPIDLSYGRKMAVARNKSDGDVFFFFFAKVSDGAVGLLWWRARKWSNTGFTIGGWEFNFLKIVGMMMLRFVVLCGEWWWM